MAPRYLLSLGLLSITMSGCASVATEQDWLYKLAQKHRAGESYQNCFSAEQRSCHSCDFKAGFKTGYYETSIGRDCRVPPVAPPKYWTAHYQNPEGQVAIQDWFKGYQSGISSAIAAGHRYFHEVPVSTQAPVVNKTACGMCQSCEPCSCLNGQTLVSPMHGLEHFSARENTLLGEQATVAVVNGEKPSGRAVKAALQSQNSLPEASLIGGFGATSINMIGAMDAAVMYD
jgi:hypothetical protein